MATLALVVLVEWTGASALSWGAAATTTGAVALLSLGVGWSRRAFALIGAALLVAAALVLPDARDAAQAAFGSASFIAAFFTALTAIRSAATTSPAIEACGRFLAEQPPGRRYGALTLGGQLFGLILMYGAISLLGSLAASSAAREANAEIRAHRTRRMLIAIQRGFVSTLPWSPLAFAMAISITLVPGADWADAVGPCAVSGLLLAGMGWALDSAFKPRLSTPPPPRAEPEGRWSERLRPLLALLGVLVAAVGALHAATGLRVVALVMTVVPLVALGWVALQERGGGRWRRLGARARAYATSELPLNASEVVLLVMAGFIGALGARLSAPLVAASGLDLGASPGWAILLAVFWTIPLAGQVGMNPILAVSLLAPLLPGPREMGVSPTAVIVAVTGGWALSGATSPFTASTLLVGRLGGVGASHVGLRWNGAYALACGAALSLWVCVVAAAW